MNPIRYLDLLNAMRGVQYPIGFDTNITHSPQIVNRKNKQ